jgi:hypothetical protein
MSSALISCGPNLPDSENSEWLMQVIAFVGTETNFTFGAYGVSVYTVQK